MKKRLRKRCAAALLALSMTIPMFGNLSVYAQDKVVDSFYILDEEGNPITIEITQSDLDSFTKEKENYGLMTADETGEEGTGEEIEDIIGIVRFNRDVTTFNYKNVKTGRTGYLSPLTTGEAAYLGTQEDGILCYVSGVKMLVDPSDVAAILPYKTVVDGEEKKELISTYYTADGYLLHSYTYFSSGDAAKPNSSTTRVGLAPSYLTERQDYYSYDGHYFYESFETMIEDYKNDTRVNSVNPKNPHYNYYQYLSFHTTAIYSGEEYDEYIVDKKGKDSGSAMLNTGDIFVDTQNTYTINSMLMFGIAINESGWGLSNLAKDKNNLFGLKATDNNPYGNGTTYDSVTACIEDFAYGWMHTGYLDGSDSRYRGPHLGDKNSGINVKYASDPYWGEKGASRPYYYDTSNADYGRFTLGIATSGEINLYKEADTSSKVIYTSEAGPGGALYDYPVVVLDTVTNDDGAVFYKLISDMTLKDDRSARNVDDQYKPSRDYVYAQEKDIQIVLNGTGDGVMIPDPEELPEHILKRHTYETEFQWSDDYKTCKVTFRCDECNISKTENCKVTSKDIEDGIEYTATCEFEGKTYTDKQIQMVLPFTDVKTTDWFYKYVEWAYQEKVTVGYIESDGTRTFKPENTCNRAENITFLYNIMGGTEPAEGTKNPFADVEADDWYYDFVIWAAENGYASGYEQADGSYTFQPLKNCTRAEIITFIYNVKGGSPVNNAKNPFADIKEGKWYYDFVLWGYENDIISGYEEKDGSYTFQPDKVCSRAEVATMLYRAFAE